MSIIMDGKALALEIKEKVKEMTNVSDKTYFLTIITVGDDEASKVYVRNKIKSAEECGILCKHIRFEESISENKLIEYINELKSVEFGNNILVQLPLPKHIKEDKIIEAIGPLNDVDGFHPENIGKLFTGKKARVACTPGGIMTLLNHYNISLSGKHCVIVGRSNIVGKPMAALMLNENATVTVCHSKTKNLSEITKQADILIVAIGKSKFITSDMIKEGCIVVDVGINRDENGKLCGDVDFEQCKDKTSYITPVPGGVGPLTVATLMYNCINK